MIIINTATGKVQSSKVFDTYKSSVLFDKFIKRTIPKGYIVIAACKDDCVTELSE